MPKLKDVCRYVRSKNAGPFWVTIDVFFTDQATYYRYREDPAIDTNAVASLFGIPPADVKRFEIEQLSAIKFSYPRQQPQGGAVERDLHSGQQYVPLLDVELV